MKKYDRRKLIFVMLFLFAACSTRATAQEIGGRFVPIMRVVDSQETVRLQSMEVQTEIIGSLAKTEVQLLFFNPNHRVLEGELNFPLLEGQSIASFALEMEDGSLREAVTVDKAKGREAFDSVTRRRIDPALLEKTTGNNFKLRVYPLNPQRTRRVVLRYSERLQPGKGGFLYRLPLDYARELNAFTLNISAVGLSGLPKTVKSPFGNLLFQKKQDAFYASFGKSDFNIKEKEAILTLAFPLGEEKRLVTQKFKGVEYFYAELPASLLGKHIQGEPLPKLKRLAILWDASGSMASRNLDAELSLLKAVFEKHPNLTVDLQVVRDAAEPMRTIQIKNGNWKDLHREILNARPDGATNLMAYKPSSDADATLIFSDGIINYQGERGEPLDFALFKAPVYTVLSSNSGNPATLRRISDGTGGVFIDLTRRSYREGAALLFKRFPVIDKIQAEGITNVVLSPRTVTEKQIAVSGILKGKRGNVTLRYLLPGGAAKTVLLRVESGTHRGSIAAYQWARMNLDALESLFYKNRDTIKKLGKDFSLVTQGTSLIVLDRVEDYARYQILPPAELRSAYEQLLANTRAPNEQQARARHRAHLDSMWQSYQEWWKTDFPRDLPPEKPPLRLHEPISVADRGVSSAAKLSVLPGGTSQPKNSSSYSMGGSSPVENVKRGAQTQEGYDIEKMKKAPKDDMYRVYLSQRDKNVENPYFYLDAAALFHERKMPHYARRALSNLAEIALEDKRLLRLLANRLMEYGEKEKAIAIYHQVRRIAEEEPQSYRDLALAYQAAGDYEKAVHYLWHIASNQWDWRFNAISQTALVEMNNVLSKGRQKGVKSNIPVPYVREMPLDLRVVLTWDTDNTSVNLVIRDPNSAKEGQRYRDYNAMYQGGRTEGNYRGYGPQTFELKKAKPGKYSIMLHYGGNFSQFAVPYTTATVRVYRNYGRPNERVEIFELRLDGKNSGTPIPVTEFTIK